MGRRRQRDYFTGITDVAVCAYNGTGNSFQKNRIFNRFIKYAFDKLAENTIHKYKAYYYETSYQDFHSDVVTHLIEKIHTYDPNKGKSFSWFTVIARNYVIQTNRKNYKRLKTFDGTDKEVDDKSFDFYSENESMSRLREVFAKFEEYVQDNLDELFEDHLERTIADCVLEVIKIREELYSFKKKQIYLLIRERSLIDKKMTFKVTDVIKKLERIFRDIKEEVLK